MVLTCINNKWIGPFQDREDAKKFRLEVGADPNTNLGYLDFMSRAEFMATRTPQPININLDAGIDF